MKINDALREPNTRPITWRLISVISNSFAVLHVGVEQESDFMAKMKFEITNCLYFLQCT